MRCGLAARFLHPGCPSCAPHRQPTCWGVARKRHGSLAVFCSRTKFQLNLNPQCPGGDCRCASPHSFGHFVCSLFACWGLFSSAGFDVNVLCFVFHIGWIRCMRVIVAAVFKSGVHKLSLLVAVSCVCVQAVCVCSSLLVTLLWLAVNSLMTQGV